MPKNKILNDVEKGKIKILKENGLSNREIGRQINRSEKVVRNYIKLDDKYGATLSKYKRYAKVTRRQINMIKQEATRNKLTSSQIIAKLQLPRFSTDFKSGPTYKVEKTYQKTSFDIKP